MSHHIYQTRAIIIDSQPVGEANRNYVLFTRELGLVTALAQGVRYQKSKLRFALQPWSLVEVSLVRGKQIWRLINGMYLKSYYQEFKDTPHKFSVLIRSLSLVKRLVHGEESYEQLYDRFEHAAQFLRLTDESVKFSQDELRAVEYSLVLNMLYELGYLADNPDVQWFIGEPLTRELLAEMLPYRQSIVAEINRSLKESQL